MASSYTLELLKAHSRTAEKGWFSILGVAMLRNGIASLGPGEIAWNDVSYEE
jgi:hypothetical protein